MDDILLTQAARTIVQNHKKIKAFWDEIDHFQKFGATPAENQKVLKRNIDDLSIGQIVTACFTLPPWITKAKKRLATLPDGAEKLQLQLEIELKEQELNDIKALRQ